MHPPRGCPCSPGQDEFHTRHSCGELATVHGTTLDRAIRSVDSHTSRNNCGSGSDSSRENAAPILVKPEFRLWGAGLVVGSMFTVEGLGFYVGGIKTPNPLTP